MSQAEIPVWTCDRCGATEEMRRIGQEYAWSKIAALQCNGPLRIGDLNSPDLRQKKDLCPNCTAALDAWWRHVG